MNGDGKEVVTIDLDDDHDRRRWRCPRGHMSWEPTNEHFHCPRCARSWDVDGEFDALVNDNTRERVPRERIHLTSAAGNYKALAKHGRHSV